MTRLHDGYRRLLPRSASIPPAAGADAAAAVGHDNPTCSLQQTGCQQHGAPANAAFVSLLLLHQPNMLSSSPHLTPCEPEAMRVRPTRHRRRRRTHCYAAVRKRRCSVGCAGAACLQPLIQAAAATDRSGRAPADCSSGCATTGCCATPRRLPAGRPPRCCPAPYIRAPVRLRAQRLSSRCCCCQPA